MTKGQPNTFARIFNAGFNDIHLYLPLKHLLCVFKLDQEPRQIV